MPSAAVEKQLQVISEIANVADRNGVPLSLRGGWAVDFAIGRITRHHDDIDFNAWTEDADRLEEALLNAGYELEGTPPEPRTLRNFLKYGEGIQIAFVEKVNDTTICPTDYPEYPLPIDLMQGSFRTLGGATCRTPPLKALLVTKEAKLFWDEGEVYRQKDLIDLDLLREHLAH
jgi:hypothetical protein